VARILLDSGTAYSKLYDLDEGRYEILSNRTLNDLLHRSQAAFEQSLNARCHSERSEESPPAYDSPRHSEERDSSPPLHGPRGNLGSGPAPAQNDICRLHRRLTVVAATGHNASRFSSRVLNELLALAYGGLKLVEDDSFVLVDCGARDIKMVRVQDRRVQEMNWNTECGAFCGQTVELLLGHFGLRAEAIAPATRPLAVTCGVLGMTQLFDLIAADVAPAEALARFVRGIAENVQRFAGRPDRFYLSGGFCDNRLFLDSLDCQVTPLGRFVLLEGLRAEMARPSPEMCEAGLPIHMDKKGTYSQRMRGYSAEVV